MTIFDLASVLRNDGMETAAIEIDYVDHRATARQLSKALGVPVPDLPGDGLFGAEELVEVGSHYGTHVDGPTHYADIIDGRVAQGVDMVPLDRFFGRGVTLDFRWKDVEAITSHDLQTALERVHHPVAPGDVVMTWVGVEDGYYDDPRIRERGAGLNGEALQWLIAHGVRFTGTDSLTQDMPIPWMEARFRAGDRASYFPVHRIGGQTDYLHIEKMHGLGALPGSEGYTIAAFPIKLEGASGAWTRAIALDAASLEPDTVRLIDLSQPIRRYSMEPQQSTIRTHGRDRRRRQWAKHLGVPVSEIDPRGSWDLVTTSTRAGTHLEAPYRFGPECAGSAARTVDKVPLDWCWGPGVLLDFSGREDRATGITVGELQAALSRAGHTLTAGDIVLLRTGAEDAFDGDPKFAEYGHGLTRASLIWLVEQGIRVIGTDAESLDRPPSLMLADLRRGEAEGFYPVHRAAREYEHCEVLKLGNLRALPEPTGFRVLVQPVKIEGAGSGWVRAVAVVDQSAGERHAT